MNQTPPPPLLPQAFNSQEAFIERLDKLAFWLHWNAIAGFITAAFIALSIVGLLVAWLPAWAAWLLWQSAQRLRGLEQEARTGTASPEALADALSKTGLHFVLWLAFMIAWLLLVVAAVAFLITSGTLNNLAAFQ